MEQRYPLAAPREMPFLDANKITQHHLTIGEMCQRHLGHVLSKTTNWVADLRHGVDMCPSHVQVWFSWSERGTVNHLVIGSIPSKTRQLKFPWI